MIFVSNQRQNDFCLYLEMEFPSLINLYAIRLYLETDKCLSLIPIFLVVYSELLKSRNRGVTVR